MRTIDIEAMAARRAREGAISFRRTEADRRPARRVIRPNDEPMPHRFERAEALRRALNERPLLDGVQRRDAISNDDLIPEVLALLLGEPRGLKELATLLRISENKMSHVGTVAETRGLIWKQVVPKGARKLLLHLTEAGRVEAQGEEHHLARKAG